MGQSETENGTLLHGNHSEKVVMKTRWLLVPIGFLVLAGGACGGCIFEAGSGIPCPGLVEFSPDSSMLAYSFAKGIQWRSLLPANGVLCMNLEVRWRPVTSAQDQGAFPVDELAVPRFDFYVLSEHVHWVFSPDSRHLAVVSPHNIDIIDIASGKSRRVKGDGDLVSCLFWTAPDEIVYMAHSSRFRLKPEDNNDPDEEVSDVTVWRQKIEARPGDRVALFRDKRVRAGTHFLNWGLAHPSPDGRYLVFKSNLDGVSLTLLDVAKGTVRPLVPCGVLYEKKTAWKPDGSAVLCACSTMRGGCHAVLVEPETGKTEDLTALFEKTFGRLVPKLDPLWTADGRFVVVRPHEAPSRGALLQVHPWKVIPLGDQLARRQNLDKEEFVTLRRVPLAGWVLAKWDNKWFAVDYGGNTIVPVPFDGRDWSWSPDGRYVAGTRPGANKNVKVYSADPAHGAFKALENTAAEYPLRTLTPP